MTGRSAHASTTSLGNWAEDHARHYLCERGLQYIGRNFRAAGGEIDLIMRDGATIAFIEVRMRASERFGGAAHSVGRSKQMRLVRTAEAWLQSNPSARRQACRFDVVALQGGPPNPTVEWLRSAFDA